MRTRTFGALFGGLSLLKPLSFRRQVSFTGYLSFPDVVVHEEPHGDECSGRRSVAVLLCPLTGPRPGASWLVGNANQDPHTLRRGCSAVD